MIRIKRSFVLAGAAAFLCLCACDPVVGTVRFAAPDDAAPSYGSTPFPSDAFMERGRIGPIPSLEQAVPFATEGIQAHLSALDGWSTRPTVEVFVDGPVDALTAQQGVFVIGLSDGLDRGAVMPWRWRYDAERARIAGAPERGTVLEERQRYAIVVTDALRGVGGGLARSEGFERLLASDEDELPLRHRSTRAAFDQAARMFGPSHVLAVAAFTVQSARTPLLRAREQLEHLPPPELSFSDPALVFAGDERLTALMGRAPRHDDGERAGQERLGWGLGTGLAHDHVGVVATGELVGVTFRRPDRGGQAGFMPDSGTFDVDDDGNPRVVGPERIPVTLALPAAPPPVDGYPVALFGHGLGASRAQLLAFVETFAREGWAVAAIDASGHGSRFDDVDEKNNVAEQMPEFQGDARLVDGFGDIEGIGTSLALFHEMRNVAAMRDEMRQTVLDWGQLVIALQSTSLDLSALSPGDPDAARLDGSRIAYFGESFGGVLGATLSSVEPRVGAFFLDVPGGGVLDMTACHSPALRPVLNLFVPDLYGVDGATLDRFHPLIGFGNAILDGADPLAFARHTLFDRPRIDGVRLRPRHVVLVMVEGDEVLSNSGTLALARAMGLPILAPHTRTHGLPTARGPLAGNLLGQTAALMMQSPATHGGNWQNIHGERKYYPFDLDAIAFDGLEQTVPVTNPVEETHDMVRRFVRDLAAGVVPTIETTPLPRDDFDDDGVLDDDDDTPYGY